MKNEAVVAMDFGSSFTKFAVRRSWNDTTALQYNLPLAHKTDSFCVPSLAAVVRSGGQDTWLFGMEAAAQPPADNVIVYRNWKATIFGETAGQGAGGGGASMSLEKAEQVGLGFFRELRARLGALGQLPLRVCVPKLPGGSSGERRIEALLRSAGWTLAEGRASAYEPEANALGLMGRGRNVTWFPPGRYGERHCDIPKMLDHHLSEAYGFRQDSYGLLVVDIGAFTTDFGYIRFDLPAASNGSKGLSIRQQSVALGVRELDAAVLKSLSEEARTAIEAESVESWDALQRKLYSGSPIALRRRSGGMLVAGEGKERAAVDSAIHDFADRVWEARKRFCAELPRNCIDAEFLTGGGALIAGLHGRIGDTLRNSGPGWLEDLADPDAPRDALRAWPAAIRERETELRARQNWELIRGGSAIGACSVYLE